MIVRLPKQIILAFEAEAASTAPYEACGLFLGQRRETRIIVSSLHVSKNVTARDPLRSFEVDPELHLRLQKEARAEGEQVLGVWHSHPDGPPLPSMEDQRRSTERGWVWLITGRAENRWTTAAFIAGQNDPGELKSIDMVCD